MAVALLLPLVTGVVTKLRAGSAIKAVSTAVLSVVTGIVSTALASPAAGIPVVETAYAILFAFVSATASYYGFWKPTGVAPAVQKATAEVGLD
ncbi:hypothetical protein GTQ99_00130 [Kineococcus sp. T13]|uniref:hypothetical protein n=1 Tax=Kineococcus vitellinus TaxID=2696565 RepID=UPI001412157A|nr:hypothetical protein [Kineococcus vitellinus]NAZ73837.1 hypothetical protein [Kineococcus vitellinus]